MFVLTVTDRELTSVRGIFTSLDVALHERDAIVTSEYADLPATPIDGNPLRLRIESDGGEFDAEVEIHENVALR